MVSRIEDMPPPFVGMNLSRKEWCVVIQQRSSYNGRFAENDFRGYRKFSVWPKLFSAQQECETFLRECFTFRNLHGRKMSASATHISTLRRLTRGRA